MHKLNWQSICGTSNCVGFIYIQHIANASTLESQYFNLIFMLQRAWCTSICVECFVFRLTDFGGGCEVGWSLANFIT